MAETEDTLSSPFNKPPSAAALTEILENLRRPPASATRRAAPRFSPDELRLIEEEAHSSLLNQDGGLDDPGHWLGLVIDLSRSLRVEVEHRLNG